jgi:hypothetical protein
MLQDYQVDRMRSIAALDLIRRRLVLAQAAIDRLAHDLLRDPMPGENMAPPANGSAQEEVHHHG